MFIRVKSNIKMWTEKIYQLTIFTGVKQFIADWKEFQEASQPMPDPPGTKPFVVISEKFWKVSPKFHYLALKETCLAYFLYWKNKDDFINMVVRDTEYIRLREEKKMEAEPNDQTSPENSQNFEIDFQKIMKQVNEKYPNIPKSIDEVVEKRHEVKAILADKLETMSEAIGGFMEGYKQGKLEARKEVVDDKDYIKNNFPGVFEIFDNQTDPNKNETEERGKVKDNGVKGAYVTTTTEDNNLKS